MFNQKTKTLEKGGAKKMKRNFIVPIVTFMLVLSLTSLGLAQDIRIAASIGNRHSMAVKLYQVPASGGAWTEITDLTAQGMDFGALTLDTTYSVYRASVYYVVEVTVDSNKSDWWVKHDGTSVANGGGNLDYNINVSFFKVTKAGVIGQPDIETSIGAKASYGSCILTGAKTFTKSQISPGWLRIYYGIATGSGDASDVTAIGADKAAGSYSGKAIITLSS